MDTKKTPNEDLMNKALKHYEEASSAIHHYNSDIPKAIRQFYELRSRLEPDIELDSDVKVYNERQDLQARTRIPVEPDMKVDGISEAAKWREPDKKSADFTDEDMNHAITGE